MTEATEAIISLRAVTKTYGQGPAAFQALKGVDLDIPAGEFVAIIAEIPPGGAGDRPGRC